jgi:hypothetical protein
LTGRSKSDRRVPLEHFAFSSTPPSGEVAPSPCHRDRLGDLGASRDDTPDHRDRKTHLAGARRAPPAAPPRGARRGEPQVTACRLQVPIPLPVPHDRSADLGVSPHRRSVHRSYGSGLIVARAVVPRPARRARRALPGASRSAPRAACAADGGTAHPHDADKHNPSHTPGPRPRTPSARRVRTRGRGGSLPRIRAARLDPSGNRRVPSRRMTSPRTRAPDRGKAPDRVDIARAMSPRRPTGSGRRRPESNKR